MTINEMIKRIREPDNWTDEFFTEIEPAYMQHLNTVRNTLVKDGLWDRFDKAFSEWQRPGQAAVVAAPKGGNCMADIQSSGFACFACFACFANIEEHKKSLLPSFPACGLPGVTQIYTLATAESLQVPVDMAATLVLSVLSMCLQGKYKVLVKADWVESINLYVIVIARPSERKTPTLREVTRPVFEYVRSENERRKGSVAEYALEKKILNGKLRNIEESLSKRGNKSPYKMQDALDCQKELSELEEVNYIQLIVDDITPEALVRVMKENNERMALVSAEGGIFGMMAGRYSNNTNIDIFLKSYSGEYYSSARVGSGGIELNEPLLTIALAVQPQIITDIMNNKDFRGKGLLARFLYSMPESRVGTRVYRSKPIDPDIRKEYEDLVNELLKLPDLDGFTDKTIRLSPEADKLSEEFNQWIEKRLTNEFEPIEDWSGKLHGNVIRIAGLFHVVKHKGDAVNVLLEGDTMQSAIDIGKYYVEHSKAVFDMMGLSDPPEMQDAKYIINRIAPVAQNTQNTQNTDIKFISKKNAFDLCRPHFEKTEEMEPGLKVLLEHGYIVIMKQKRESGGRPSEIIYINPQYYKWKEGQK